MLPRTAPSPETRCQAAPLRQLGARRLTRAHLALSRRSTFSTEARAFAVELSRSLSKELGAELQLDATLLETRVNPANELTDHSHFAVFDLGGLASHAVLELELPFIVAALAGIGARAPGQAGPATRLTRIEEATLGYLLLSALHATTGSTFAAKVRPRLRRVTHERVTALAPLPLRQPHLAIDLRFTLGTLRGGGRLYLPSFAARAVIDEYAQDPVGSLAPELCDVPQDLTCVLPAVTLSRMELARLRQGDALVLEGASLREGQLMGPARLRSPLFLLDGELTAAGFTYQRARTRASPQESAMKPLPDRTEVTPPLPIEVEVILTRFRMTLAELATLKPGALLGLQITANEPVTLRIGERTIARAELVDIEGEVAARITSLNP